MTDMILPEGWVEVKFTTLLDIQGGTQPPKSAFVYKILPGYIQLLQIRDFGKKPVPTYILNTNKLKLCKKNDLLIGRYGASLGKICTGLEGAYNVALAKVIKPKELNDIFVKYYLESQYFQQPLLLLSRSAQNGFNKDDLNFFPFILPPIAEQEEIAQRVDRAIGHVDELKSRLETLLTTLKTFRQSVLNAAVTGKLTENWTVAPLKELTIKIGSGSTPKGGQEVYKTTGIPLIRSMNIHFDKIKFEDLVYIDDKQADKLKNVTVKEDDVLLNITGASIGRVNIAPVSLKGARVNQHVSILRCKLELLFPNFLKTILSSTLIQNWMNNENYGATRQALTKSMIENLEISFPPLEEQEEIVKRVEAYFALADQIEKQVQSALDKVNLLTQSILAKAFRGELTKEWRQKNPELISGENSAEALLKRIKAEKDALEKPSKKTKNTKVKVT